MKRKPDELPEGEVKNFCLAKKKQVKLREQLAEHCYSIGSYSAVLNVLPNEVEIGMERSQIVVDRVQTYSRLLKDGKLYVAESYLKDMKTISSYVQYTENNEEFIGSVYCFVKTFDNCLCMETCHCEPAIHYAIMRILHREHAFHVNLNNCHISTQYLYRCYSTDDILAIPITELMSVCVYIPIEQKNNVIERYVGIPINSRELE